MRIKYRYFKNYLLFAQSVHQRVYMMIEPTMAFYKFSGKSVVFIGVRSYSSRNEISVVLTHHNSETFSKVVNILRLSQGHPISFKLTRVIKIYVIKSTVRRCQNLTIHYRNSHYIYIYIHWVSRDRCNPLI